MTESFRCKLGRPGLRQSTDRFLEDALLGILPVAVELRQRIRIARADTALLRNRHAKPAAQRAQHDLIERALTFIDQRPYALGKYAVDVVQDYVRHTCRSVVG